jgi:hypothetical protein
VPSDWVPIELVGIGLDSAAVADLQSRLSDAHPRSKPVEAELARMFQEVARAASRNGVLEAYLYSRAVGDRMAVASLTIAAATPEHPREHDDLGLLALRLRSEVDPEQPRPDISVAETLAGEALRSERRRVITTENGDSLESHEVQYFAPIPGDKRVLVLTFTTPNVGAARPFTNLFDAIAEGLQWKT